MDTRWDALGELRTVRSEVKKMKMNQRRGMNEQEDEMKMDEGGGKDDEGATNERPPSEKRDGEEKERKRELLEVVDRKAKAEAEEEEEETRRRAAYFTNPNYFTKRPSVGSSEPPGVQGSGRSLYSRGFQTSYRRFFGKVIWIGGRKFGTPWGTRIWQILVLQGAPNSVPPGVHGFGAHVEKLLGGGWRYWGWLRKMSTND